MPGATDLLVKSNMIGTRQMTRVFFWWKLLSFFFSEFSCSQSIASLLAISTPWDWDRQHIHIVGNSYRLFIRVESKIFIIYLRQPMKQEKCGTCRTFQKAKKTFSSSWTSSCAQVACPICVRDRRMLLLAFWRLFSVSTTCDETFLISHSCWIFTTVGTTLDSARVHIMFTERYRWYACTQT